MQKTPQHFLSFCIITKSKPSLNHIDKIIVCTFCSIKGVTILHLSLYSIDVIIVTLYSYNTIRAVRVSWINSTQFYKKKSLMTLWRFTVLIWLFFLMLTHYKLLPLIKIFIKWLIDRYSPKLYVYTTRLFHLFLSFFLSLSLWESHCVWGV